MEHVIGDLADNATRHSIISMTLNHYINKCLALFKSREYIYYVY